MAKKKYRYKSRREAEEQAERYSLDYMAANIALNDVLHGKVEWIKQGLHWRAGLSRLDSASGGIAIIQYGDPLIVHAEAYYSDDWSTRIIDHYKKCPPPNGDHDRYNEMMLAHKVKRCVNNGCVVDADREETV